MTLTAPRPDRARSSASPAADPVLLRLAAVEQRLARLEGRHRVRDDRHAAALIALAASTRYLTFTAVSALAHARQVDPALLAALAAAGIDRPRHLGRFLRTVQRTPLAGLCVERVGTNGDGALWVFRAAD